MWLQKEVSYKKENSFTKKGKFNKFGSRDYRKNPSKKTFSN